MKKVLPFVLAALMIPSVALAKGPNPKAGTHPNHGKAKVICRGSEISRGWRLNGYFHASHTDVDVTTVPRSFNHMAAGDHRS